MLFTVDIGNSNIVAGLMEDENTLRFSGRIRTDRQKTREEFMIELKTLLDIYHISMDIVTGVIISSVVPELTDIVKEGMKILTGLEPLIIGRGLKTGLEIVTDFPEKVGADLIVDAVAASEAYEGNLMIVDMGTATTCSVVDADKRYLGTLIIPGVKISQDALTEKTSQLPSIHLEQPAHLIGKNTVESMKSGLIYGNAAMVDGLIDRIKEEMGTITVIVTGGTAGQIIPHCKHDLIYDPNLLLKGLWHIYHKNI